MAWIVILAIIGLLVGYSLYKENVKRQPPISRNTARRNDIRPKNLSDLDLFLWEQEEANKKKALEDKADTDNDNVQFDTWVPPYINDCPRIYSYHEVKIALPNIENIDIANSSSSNGKIQLKLEPDNEFDPKAVMLFSNDLFLGYMYQTRLRDMVWDWLEDKYPIFAVIEKYDMNPNLAFFYLGLYKPRELCHTQSFKLVGNTSNAMQEDIEFSSEGEPVLFDYNYSKERYEASDKLSLLGFMPKSANELLDQRPDLVGEIKK